MAIITPTNEAVKTLKGLHLYHADLSNCSMRVRIALEEKNLEWVSHHFNLPKREHITPEYFGINPKGVVPTLVHDGVVHVESDDIIDYIDQRFPEPPLRSSSSEAIEKMYWWMKSAVQIHVSAIKTYIYFHKMQGKMKQTDEQKNAYEGLQTDLELRKFHEQSSSGGLTEEDAKKAEQIIDGFFSKAETTLKNAQWLAGEQFTLADITWIPLHFTLSGAGFDFSNYPAVNEWVERVRQRESFKKGILQWCPTF